MLFRSPGFAASTGHSISYGTDPNFSQAIVQPSFLPVAADQISFGTNLITNFAFPDNTVESNGVYRLTYFSSNPLFASTGLAPAADPLGGLSEGQTLFARLGVQPDTINLFSDADGSQPIALDAADTSANAIHYFTVDVNETQLSLPVGGMAPGREMFLIALGGDRYQIGTDPLQFQAAMPLSLRGRQLNSATELTSVSETEGPGVEISSTVLASDKVSATTSLGSKPTLFHLLSSAALTSVAQQAAWNRTDAWGLVKAAATFSDNPARSKIESGSSINGSIALNRVDHQAMVDLGTGSLIGSGRSINIKIGRAHV